MDKRARFTLKALLIFFSIPYALAATDWKVLPGTACHPEAHVTHVTYSKYGGICNTSASEDVLIRCPVVREFSKSRSPLEVKHSGRSGSASQSMNCTLRVMSATGGDAGQMENFKLRLDSINFDSAARFEIKQRTKRSDGSIKLPDFGAYVLSCRLPASSSTSANGTQIKSCLYNYGVKEWTGD